MALVLADRVRETSNTAGSGPFTLAGAPQGYQTLSAGIGNANSSYFVAWDGAAAWLVFSGTYSGGGNSVSVDSVLAQSAGFAGFAGAKTIWCDAPALLISPLLQMSASASGVQVTSKLGIGMVPTNVLDITQNQNAISVAQIANTSAGVAARADLRAFNGTSSAYVIQFGTGFTTSGIARADGTLFYGGGTGGTTIGSSQAQPLYFATNATEVARFDVNGNLGIGVAPAAGTTFILDIARNANSSLACRVTNPNSGTGAGAGWYVFNDVGNSGILFQTSSTYGPGVATARPDSTLVVCNGTGGMTVGCRLANAPLQFIIANAECARFDPNGTLDIGTTAAAGPAFAIDALRNINSSSWFRLTNQSNGGGANAGLLLVNNAGNQIQMAQLSTTYSSGGIYRPDSGVMLGTGAQGLTIGSSTSAPLVFATNSVEQARFLPTGNLVLQGTAVVAAYPSDLTCQFAGNSLSGIVTNDTNAAAGVDNAMVFVRNASSVGSIQTTLTGTAFNQTSDKNLKTLDEGVTIDTGALIDGCSPHPFTWNSTGESDYGFFAQELYAVLGDYVANNPVSVGSPDEDFGTPEYRNWGVDLGKLVPLLWAEIQSLRARMTEVEKDKPPKPEGTH